MTAQPERGPDFPRSGFPRFVKKKIGELRIHRSGTVTLCSMFGCKRSKTEPFCRSVTGRVY